MGTIREKASWIESDTAVDGIATATRAAPPGGLRHYVTGITGTFSGGATAQLELKDGGTVIATWFVHDQFGLVFPSSLEITPGNSTSLVLQTGGGGITGTSSITGYTL